MWHRQVVFPVLIAAFGTLAYANSFDVPFVLDDWLRIEFNPNIRTAWPPSVAMANTNRPLATYTFAVNYALHGYDVRGYHVVNLGIHLAAGLVLYGFCRRTFARRPASRRYGEVAGELAFAVALLWTVHPLQTQAVTYIVQRLESLMGLCLLLTMYAFVRAQDSRFANRWYAASVLACAIGMGCKEVMVVAPFVVLWYDWAFLGDGIREILRRRGGYYLGLVGTYAVLAWSMLHWTEDYAGGSAGVVEKCGPLAYFGSQPGVILHYLRLCVWPENQQFLYRWPTAKFVGQILPPAAALLVLVNLTIYALVTCRPLSFLGGWFFLILAPTSSVLPIIDLAFEHRMYLPSASVIAALVLLLWELLRWMGDRSRMPAPSARRLLIAVALMLGTVLATMTYLRNEVYYDHSLLSPRVRLIRGI